MLPRSPGRHAGAIAVLVISRSGSGMWRRRGRPSPGAALVSGSPEDLIKLGVQQTGRVRCSIRWLGGYGATA